MTQSKTSVEHIDTIIDQINSLILKKEDFTAFILIALGIEYLGNFFDSEEIFKLGQSKKRFKEGVKLFPSDWYSNHDVWLYENFRGPLVHQLWTGTEIALTSNCNHDAPLSHHLKKEDGKVIFILEKLFEDFKSAAHKLKNNSRKDNRLNKVKFNQTYSEILEIEMDGISIPCSGSTS